MSRARIASLCLIAAICLTSLVANQALAAPKWMTPPTGEPIEGEPIEATGKVEKELVLLTKTGLTKVEVLCTAVKFADGLLEPAGAASGKLHYEGCITKLNGGAAAGACKPHSPGAAEGLIETNSLKAQIQLHEVSPGSKVALVELVPATGEIFVALKMGKETGSECSIGSEFKVTGAFFAQDANGAFEVEAQTHLFEASTALGGLKFGGNAATVDGSVLVDLPGLDLWSGLGAAPKWMIPPTGEPIEGEPIEATGKVEKELVLLTKTGLTKVEVLCTAVKFADGLLEPAGAASGKLHYEGCITKLNGGAAAGACKPHSPGAAEGLIETNSLKAQIQLHEVSPGSKVALVELVPATGEIFVALKMGKETGSECSIGSEFKVTGAFFAQDANGAFEVEAQTHLFEASTALGGLKFGGNAATVDGSVLVDLPGLDLWSGLGAAPKWMIPPTGEPIEGEPIEATGKVEKELVLLTKTGLTKVEVLCTAVKFADGLLEPAGAASGKLHYEGCITKLNGGAAAGACKPHSPGAAEGLIETNSLKAQIQLHEVSPGSKVALVELVPATGEIFVALKMGKETGSECSIGSEFKVTGAFFAQDANGAFEVEAQTHLFEASTALGGLKFGGNAATVDGSVLVDLPGLDLWSGLGS